MKKKQLLHTPEGVRDLYGKEYAAKLVLQEKVMKQDKNMAKNIYHV